MDPLKKEVVPLPPRPRVGYWISERKSRKFNVEELQESCSLAGIELVKLDLNHPLEAQGPLAAVIHKLTDVIAQADQGHAESRAVVERFERYIATNPSVRIVDPFDSLRQLLDRYKTYSTIRSSELNRAGEVFVPPFVDLVSNNVDENVRKLREAGVRYPFVCKHVVAHGSRMAHQMAIVFHEGAVRDCEPPCVAQTFVPHDALLYKIFVVGSKHFVVERPSLKNFDAAVRPTIFFDSHDVSKPDSVSLLSILDDDEGSGRPRAPPIKADSIDKLVAMLRPALGMALFGVDVVVEKTSGLCAIIDINAFPGYEGVPDIYRHVTDMLKEVVSVSPVNGSSAAATDTDSGVDTGYSSDERRPHANDQPVHRIKRFSLNLGN